MDSDFEPDCVRQAVEDEEEYCEPGNPHNLSFNIFVSAQKIMNKFNRSNNLRLL